MTVLYSFPPGTGGDHIVNLLNGVNCTVEQRTVANAAEIKSIEHAVQYLGQSVESYQTQLEKLITEGNKVIASHWLNVVNGAIMVRAVWDDPELDVVFASRDMLTMNFASGLVPTIKNDSKLMTMLQSNTMTSYRRWLMFMINHIQHGEAALNESLDENWIRFNIDRIFSEVFAEDVFLLAEKLGIRSNYYQIKHNHRQWLEKNPREDFTLRRAVRHLSQFKLQSFLP